MSPNHRRTALRSHPAAEFPHRLHLVSTANPPRAATRQRTAENWLLVLAFAALCGFVAAVVTHIVDPATATLTGNTSTTSTLEGP